MQHFSGIALVLQMVPATPGMLLSLERNSFNYSCVPVAMSGQSAPRKSPPCSYPSILSSSNSTQAAVWS